MLDDLRRFSTDSCAAELRPQAWEEVLAQTGLRAEPDAGAGARIEGHVASRRAPSGSVFSRLVTSPQRWSAQAPVRGQALLAVALLEGTALLTEGGGSVGVRAGEMAVLDPAADWRLQLITRCRIVLVRLQSAGFALRLLRAGLPALNLVTRASAVGAMALKLAASIGDELDRLAADDLLPVEATLADMLVSALSRAEHPLAGDATAVQLRHLRRVCRTIEARLGDPALDLDTVAALEGLSPRYVQKLLRQGGSAFGDYVRERRLDRCRLDLTNRALGHFTITELCYRWGFGDPANFSRAFTCRYGISPRAWRAEPPREAARASHRGSPLPHEPGFRDAVAVPATVQPRTAAPVASSAPRWTGEGAPGAPGTGLLRHHHIAVSDRTVHWGYFSPSLQPVAHVRSGDLVTLETLTQHAGDDRARMIDGDAGAESVFAWTRGRKAVDRRGAGPMDASIYGRGAGEGFGVHICTGPVHVQDAQPGDVLEVRILDIAHRPSASPAFRGRVFGSNAAAWWGFQYDDLVTEPKKREVVTLYEIDGRAEPPQARAVYSYRWTPQTDPDGVRHETIDYPGVPVDEHSVYKRYGVLAGACVPVRPHFGVLAVAPRECELVDSIPPSYFGGNLDNWRAGKGATLFLPVAVAGALFSAGDPHASQGDGEVCGTAIECSLTGVFQLVLHKREDIAGRFLGELNYPFLETADAWVVQGFTLPNHLAELGERGQAQVYARSSLDAAMRDAFRKMRHYLMKAHALDEDEALLLMSVAVDFGVTQVADGNWGVHAVLRKEVLPSGPRA